MYYRYKNGQLPHYFTHLFDQIPNHANAFPTMPHRHIRPPSRFDNTINYLPFTQNIIRIATSNTKYCRVCIRHFSPKTYYGAFINNGLEGGGGKFSKRIHQIFFAPCLIPPKTIAPLSNTLKKTCQGRTLSYSGCAFDHKVALLRKYATKLKP
jgi:hypothetical protein